MGSLHDERRLVRRVQEGDRRAFEEFLDSYGSRVHALVRRNVENASDAEDVTKRYLWTSSAAWGRFVENRR